MIQVYQNTIARRVEICGVGLHSGRSIRVELLPAEVGTGVVFKRVDLVGHPTVAAHVSSIMATDLNTTIGVGSVRIATIEHLMAALAGLSIDNVLVKLDGPEVPVMDGSAITFVEKILEAGIASQDRPRRLYVVREPFSFQQGDKWIKIEPSDYISYSMQIDFKSRVIGRQSYEMLWEQKSIEQIYSSRTFCHLNDVNAMRVAGLALGGSLENAVVVSDEAVLNSEGLRFHDEFVRHKLLDCIGDLYLLGGPIVGKISAYKSGHGLHAGFMKALWARRAELLSTVESVKTFGSRLSSNLAAVGMKG